MNLANEARHECGTGILPVGQPGVSPGDNYEHEQEYE